MLNATAAATIARANIAYERAQDRLRAAEDRVREANDEEYLAHVSWQQSPDDPYYVAELRRQKARLARALAGVDRAKAAVSAAYDELRRVDP